MTDAGAGTLAGRDIADLTRRAGSAALSGCRLLIIAAWLLSQPAAAEVLGNEADLLDETIAFRDWLKTYDNIKQYGAERVMDRDRKPYMPDGLRAGNYLIFPTIGTAVVFDDNIYATARNRESDIRYEVVPVVRLQSNFPRHALNFAFGGRLTRYAEHSDFDSNDVFAKADGALHFNHAHTLAASMLSSFEHEDRLSPDAPLNAREKTPVWYNQFSVGLKRDAGRLYGGLTATAQRWDYQDVRARDGSLIDQDFRDAERYSGALSVGYRFSPGYEFQGRVRGVRQLGLNADGIARDLAGYDVMAGLASELSPLLRWRILGGYGIRDADQPGIPSASGAIAEAEIQWLPTQTLTIYATLRRAFEDEAGTESALARIDNLVRLRAEYEVWRNLLFTFSAEYRDMGYLAESRRDRTIAGRLSIDYYHTKNWLFSIGYEHVQRHSNIDEFDLTRNKIWIGATLRF